MSHDIAAPIQSHAAPHAVADASVEALAAQAIAAEVAIASPMRRKLLTMGAATCGAVAAGAIFGLRPAHADLVKTAGKILYLDPIVLNFAYEMEELEADFFSRLTRTPSFNSLSSSEQSALNLIASQDQGHFDLLNAAREVTGYSGSGHFNNNNAEATKRPRFYTYPKLNSRDDVLKAAIDLKESVLFGYHGAIELVRDKQLLRVAASIAGVEGRHDAVLRELAGLDPVPAPFEGALGAQATGGKLAARYGFEGGAKR